MKNKKKLIGFAIIFAAGIFIGLLIGNFKAKALAQELKITGRTEGARIYFAYKELYPFVEITYDVDSNSWNSDNRNLLSSLLVKYPFENVVAECYNVKTRGSYTGKDSFLSELKLRLEGNVPVVMDGKVFIIPKKSFKNTNK